MNPFEFIHTDGWRRISRRRSPNRAAWRFPDWTAVGFRFERNVHGISATNNRALFRDPFLGSAAILAWHYCRRDAAGPHEATQGELSSRMAALTTGGDLNPTCLGLFRPLVSGGLVAGRRSRRARI